MNHKNIKYGKQDFDNGYVEVYVNNQIIICDMFQDNDGDFGFYLDGEEYYFYLCETVK